MDRSNIEAEKQHGGQPGNQNAAKWTEQKAMSLGKKMIKWLNEVDDSGEDKGNIFFKEFLIKKNVYNDLISYLSEKYPSFSDLIREAKQIQEMKLVKFGVADRLQPRMTEFVLKNHHGYRDKSDIEHSLKPNMGKYSPEELLKMAKAIEISERDNK